MKQTRLIMGMPITVDIVEPQARQADFDRVFSYFEYVDAVFSTYKPTSEISRINRNEIQIGEASSDMQTIFVLAEKMKQEANGFFNIRVNGAYDPSGVVKGWAIQNAAELLKQAGFSDFYIEAGGDIYAAGHNSESEPWAVGIRNPFNTREIIKVLSLTNSAVATSGTYERGAHIYNPHDTNRPVETIVSLTVIGDTILDADRFATAAFAMGRTGIQFIERVQGLEGYMVDRNGLATITSGFDRYVTHA